MWCRKAYIPFHYCLADQILKFYNVERVNDRNYLLWRFSQSCCPDGGVSECARVFHLWEPRPLLSLFWDTAVVERLLWWSARLESFYSMCIFESTLSIWVSSLSTCVFGSTVPRVLSHSWDDDLKWFPCYKQCFCIAQFCFTFLIGLGWVLSF